MGDLQTALGKIHKTPVMTPSKIPELMSHYEMQGLLDPDQFSDQLKMNFHVKLTDHELAAIVAVFDPHGSGYLEMTEFVRGFQTLRYLKQGQHLAGAHAGGYGSAQDNVREGADSAWHGDRLGTPAAQGLLHERLGQTSPRRGGGSGGKGERGLDRKPNRRRCGGCHAREGNPPPRSHARGQAHGERRRRRRHGARGTRGDEQQ